MARDTDRLANILQTPRDVRPMADPNGVGTQHFVLSSSLGRILNPLHADGLTAFILSLKE